MFTYDFKPYFVMHNGNSYEMHHLKTLICKGWRVEDSP